MGLLAEPVLPTKTGPAAEVPLVAREECKVVDERDGGEAQVRVGQRRALTLEEGAQPRVLLRSLEVERQDHDAVEGPSLQLRAQPRAAPCPGEAVEQLAYREAAGTPVW